MLIAYVAEDGTLYWPAPSHYWSGSPFAGDLARELWQRRVAMPAHLDWTTMDLELQAEGERFHPASSAISTGASLALHEATEGWARPGSGRAIATGEVFRLEGGFLFLGGPRPTQDSAARRRASIFGGRLRVLLFFRDEEVAGWQDSRRRLRLYCLAWSELWRGPEAKVVLTVRNPDGALRELLGTVRQATTDVQGLDAAFDLGLPVFPSSRSWAMKVLAAPLLGTAGFLAIGAIGIADQWPQGSPEVNTYMPLGMALLWIGLVGGAVSAWLGSRNVRRLREKTWSEMARRYGDERHCDSCGTLQVFHSTHNGWRCTTCGTSIAANGTVPHEGTP